MRLTLFIFLNICIHTQGYSTVISPNDDSNQLLNFIIKKDLSFKEQSTKNQTLFRKEKLQRKNALIITFADGYQNIMYPPFKLKKQSNASDCSTCKTYSLEYITRYNNKKIVETRTISVNHLNESGQYSLTYTGKDNKIYKGISFSDLKGNHLGGVKLKGQNKLASLISKSIGNPKAVNGDWKESFAPSKESCKATDIKDQHPKLKEHFSIPRDQGGIKGGLGWCYGFAASDLLSVETGIPISSTHTSLLLKKRRENSFLHKFAKFISKGYRTEHYIDSQEITDGGRIRGTLKALSRNKKVCSEKDMPYDPSIFGTKMFTLMFSDLKKQAYFLNGNQVPLCNDKRNFLNQYKNNLNVNFEELTSALEEKTADLALLELVEKHCKEKQIDIPKLKIRKILRPKGKESRSRRYFKKINSLLDRGKPIGVSFDVSHIENGTSSGGHATVITGKKWSDGKCLYKIRNSYGATCEPYSHDKVEDCNEEEGAFWVTGEKLYNMAYQLDYIK